MKFLSTFLLLLAMFGIAFVNTKPNNDRNELIKKYEQLIQQAKDVLKKYSTIKNHQDYRMIEKQIRQLNELRESIHFNSDDDLQSDKQQYEIEKKKTEEMIEKLEQHKSSNANSSLTNNVNKFDKDKMIERCDVLLKQANDAFDKYKKTEDNDLIRKKLRQCVVDIAKLKSKIRYSHPTENLVIEESNLKSYEKKVPDLIEQLNNNPMKQ
ncbi:uncharacterized protein LOC113790883 [Dermatophagoides pteronyssinus]|uniref:uncharacterized protein LOC113790883 n=1 Tax=Dermatophagoides pteronyssinus TaxID=6956 RepID=UPI003F66E43A